MSRFYRIPVLLALTFSLSLPPMPRLIPDASVASDFRALAQETWSQFLSVFRNRSACFGNVRLRAEKSLESRAAYDPASATVTVRVPATKAMLQGALVHEWAHHLEYQCKAHQQLRPAFLAAQGLPAGTLWREDHLPANIPESQWAQVPSEQFAEAAIELVLGERQIPTTARVRPEAVEVVADWAAGD